MKETMGVLMSERRFLPLFLTQFLGAANDNLFKNFLVILVTYRLAAQTGQDARFLVTLAAGLFILPFFLFSATAGQLADKLEKSRLIRLTKLAEIGIMGLAAIGFALDHVGFLMTVLFLMGSQSAFFGPLKYGILPDHLQKEELMAGNGLIEAGTFLAILLGTIGGGLLALHPDGETLVSGMVLLLALLGWFASRFIPAAPAADPGLTLNPNPIVETWRMVQGVREPESVFLSILGISWFWLVGATYLAQFPTYAHDVLLAGEGVVTLFLTLFSIGIGLGSLLCSRLLKGAVEATYVPLGALGMSLAALDLFFASLSPPGAPGMLLDVAGFLSTTAGWRILADLFFLALCGGLYVVPLYAIMQSRANPEHRSRVVAGNNILNALFMVVSALFTLLMLSLDYAIPEIFLTLALATLVATLYIARLLPRLVIRRLLSHFLRLFYRVELKNWHLADPLGDRAVITVNHLSFLDGLLIAAFIPGPTPVFAIHSVIARQWWIQPFLELIRAFPLDPTNPFSIRTLTRLVQDGNRCVIFPEGRITTTGALMKIYEGPGLIADKTGAPILPIRIEGAQYSPFSRLKGKVRIRLFPKITLTMLPPRRFQVPEELFGRVRRQYIGRQMYDLMSEAHFLTADGEKTLFSALLSARAIHGGGAPLVEDLERQPLSYDRVITGALVLGERLARLTRPGERVGVLLPNTAGVVLVFMGLSAHGRIPAMLNHSTGSRNLLLACEAAEITQVVTSRRFIEAGKLSEAVEALATRTRILYLEEIRQEIGWRQKVRGLVLARLAALPWRPRLADEPGDPGQPAVVLFTSGSEGSPKGVVLSHRNILANTNQLAARIDFNPSDVVFNALPVFHSFGLTVGTLLPLFHGIRIFLYPSPLHYRIIPEVVYDSRATILFGTDTFLYGYARMAHPYDFHTLRYVFAGAEKVKELTRAVWNDRFGHRILEGYGATETAPTLSINTPMHHKSGTVGRLLPGIRHRLEPVPGVDKGGRLYVTGPNVMVGYYKVERPGVLQPLEDGWYDTGDVVEVDEAGFVRIVGRAKRFAKIGGEMISLAAVEALADTVWPGCLHAVVALTDPRRGELLVLVTNAPGATRETLGAAARGQGLSELAVPKSVRVVEKMPLLGSGKVDYQAVKELAATFSAIPAAAGEN